MLQARPEQPDPKVPSRLMRGIRVVSLVVASGILAAAVASWGTLESSPPLPDSAFGSAGFVAAALFTRHALALQIVGLLLLAAIMGAVLLSGRGQEQ
jgi:NADH:ubiquinone oxidoreductase subunit 6 (subunit J)